MQSVKKLLFCLGVLGIADTALILAVSGGVNVGTLLPGVGGVPLVLWALFGPRTGLDFAFLRQWGLKTLLFAVICCCALLFVTVQCMILYHAFGDDPSQTDWCIVLGAGLRGDRPTLTLANRIATAAAFLARHGNAHVVVSGGKGPGETVTEAEAMRRGLVQAGIEPARIFIEDKATSTVENLRYSRDVIAKAGGNAAARVCVISSDFHLFRVRLLATRLGMKAHLVPSSTPWYLLPNTCIREYFAVLKSLVLDR